MSLRRALLILSSIGALLVLRHRVGHHGGRTVCGGILIGNAAAYDRFSRLLLRTLFTPIAADVARVASDRARVLEVGCGPGHLALLLARRHGLDVTGLDLDPAMIERAHSNADGTNGRQPMFQVGDVAALPYSDETFDVVVTVLSMHHWSDPRAGLDEIARVLRPGGRALVWDLRPGVGPFHHHASDPVGSVHGSPLEVVSVTRWGWPFRLRLLQRIELSR